MVCTHQPELYLPHAAFQGSLYGIAVQMPVKTKLHAVLLHQFNQRIFLPFAVYRRIVEHDDFMACLPGHTVQRKLQPPQLALENFFIMRICNVIPAASTMAFTFSMT